MNRSYAFRDREPRDHARVGAPPAPLPYRVVDPYGQRAPGSATTGVRLAELLGRLSLAFDIANGAPYGKAVRSVVLAVELGRLAGATDEELHDTFWVSLLGYLGCTGVPQDGGLGTAHVERLRRAMRET